MERGKPRTQDGFTYLGVLFLLVLLGLGLAGTGETWSLASRRAHERELLWVGNQYARAIRAYYTQSPGGARQFPTQLEDLLEDRRFAVPRRHLRQLYADPISHERFDVVLSDDGRIGGVRSHSDEAPLKMDEFPAKYRDFKGSTHYSDWMFIAENLPGSPRRPVVAGSDTGTTTPAAFPPTGVASGSGTTADPASPATATPTTADTGTPPAATTTPKPAPKPVRPGAVISNGR